jgi:hypothetical protein
VLYIYIYIYIYILNIAFILLFTNRNILSACTINTLKQHSVSMGLMFSYNFIQFIQMFLINVYTAFSENIYIYSLKTSHKHSFIGCMSKAHVKYPFYLMHGINSEYSTQCIFVIISFKRLAHSVYQRKCK